MSVIERRGVGVANENIMPAAGDILDFDIRHALQLADDFGIDAANHVGLAVVRAVTRAVVSLMTRVSISSTCPCCPK